MKWMYFVWMCLLLVVGVGEVFGSGAGVQALVDVGVDQRLGAGLPLDAKFVDERGREVTLGECLHGRPALLTPVYYECPMLCMVTLNQLGRTLNALSETVGTDFDIITISIDPKEGPELARKKKAGLLKGYRRAPAEEGWVFLTGSEESIRRVTDAVGFRYRWDEASQQFIHAGAVVVLTPDGRVSRYFLGVDYPPTAVRAALNEARGGTIGPAAERVFLYCFHYDPATGRYGLIISRALKVAGVGLVLGLAGMLAVLSRRSAARRVTGAEGGGDAPL
jgi:protein SCO1/2